MRKPHNQDRCRSVATICDFMWLATLVMEELSAKGAGRNRTAEPQVVHFYEALPEGKTQLCTFVTIFLA